MRDYVTLRGVTPDTPDLTLAQLTHPTGPAPGARKRRTGLIVGLAVAGLVVLAAAGVGAYALLGRGMAVSGVFVLANTDGIQVSSTDGETCSGKGGYADVTAGAAVNITDASNATIALGALDAGRYDRPKGCVFAWKVSGVPTGKRFYSIEVGHRGAVKLTEAQLHQRVELGLS